MANFWVSERKYGMYGKLAVKTAKPWQNLVPNCEDVAVERVESIVMLDYRVSRPPRGILKNGPGKPTQPTADQKLNRVHNVVFFWILLLQLWIKLGGGIPTPLKNMKVSWGYDKTQSSQYMESHRSHVPNHQPNS